MPIAQYILATLLASAALLIVNWANAPRSTASRSRPTALDVLIGFVTNFFDTLGIGSFATTTVAFRMLRRVPDELIPGTMLVGHSLPVIVQALIFITSVKVDPLQLVILIASCVTGSWIGAGVVASFSKRSIQFAMGVALSAAAMLMLTAMLGLLPAGGTSPTFAPWAFAIAIVASVVFGALLTVGIGNYAPSLILFSLLGIDPRAAFPIMMGSGAFAGPVAGIRFVARGRFDSGVALALALGGIPGVLIAALVVRTLPLEALRWLVLIVVIYSAIELLRAATSRSLASRTSS